MSNNPTAILDWKPSGSGDTLVFERSAVQRCKPQKLPALHPDRLRVCLFGESLAAGFPLAPAFPPAMILEDTLRAALPDLQIEVIDLAMPNMGPSEQLRVAEAAQQLGPDACVFLTGNNWYYGLTFEPTASIEARKIYAKEIEKNGVRGLTKEFRQQLSERAEVMVKALSATATGKTKAYFAIPPTNHAWERLNPLPLLPGDENKTWQSLLGEAMTAEGKKDYTKVLEISAAMAKIDQGLTGTPERFQARALLALGKKREARDAAMSAIDGCNWQNVTWALPQVPSFVADIIQTGAQKYKYKSIDIEKAFTDETASPWHEFNLFYDHCHLSAEGMRIAMARIALSLLEDLGFPAANMKTLLTQAPKPLALNLASGAIQGAHWLSQFYPDYASKDGVKRIEDSLRESVQTHALSASVLNDYVRLRHLAVSPGLSAVMPKAAHLPGVGAVVASSKLNAVFLAGALKVLEDKGAKETGELLAPILESYRSRFSEGLDLTQPSYRTWFWERTPTSWFDPQERQGSPIYRALWPKSQFSFLDTGASELNLEFVFRSLPAGRSVNLRLNGSELSAAKSETAKWQTVKIKLPQAKLKRGLNSLEVEWPAFTADTSQLLNEAKSQFEKGSEAEIFPVFGEIFALRVYI
ncbi:MAG: hypothetical protein EOP10_22520 [Proteobacteria bacterium]|nr:MAG: hypothetical protein EOP10_22520 [Pseudomonadota bacterium]